MHFLIIPHAEQHHLDNTPLTHPHPTSAAASHPAHHHHPGPTNLVSHLAIAEPLAVEHSFVILLEAQLLEESILGLVDQEAAGGHGSEEEMLGARGRDEQ